jgi:hypothetical protein
MKKRSRPSFFRHIDEDYARRHAISNADPADGALVKPAAKKGSKGVIDMSIQNFVGLAVFFVMLACLGSAASTYAIIDLAGHGPQGEQGVQGSQGDKGDQGPIGLKGLPGNDASQEMIKRLAGLWSVQQASAIAGGGFVSFNDPIVGSCVQYVLTGSPGVDACPGFAGQH